MTYAAGGTVIASNWNGSTWHIVDDGWTGSKMDRRRWNSTCHLHCLSLIIRRRWKRSIWQWFVTHLAKWRSYSLWPGRITCSTWLSVVRGWSFAFLQAKTDGGWINGFFPFHSRQWKSSTGKRGKYLLWKRRKNTSSGLMALLLANMQSAGLISTEKGWRGVHRLGMQRAQKIRQSKIRQLASKFGLEPCSYIWCIPSSPPFGLEVMRVSHLIFCCTCLEKQTHKNSSCVCFSFRWQNASGWNVIFKNTPLKWLKE